jgi:rubrerythrin
MPTKPSYLGLLNAIANAEANTYEYLTAWAQQTPNDDVRSVLRTVALREGEHHLAFAKRIDELGYDVRPKADPAGEKARAIATSTQLTDLEKLEKLGAHRYKPTKPDPFDRFFEDHSIDVRTGELLGRYIAEERDTARLLLSCYEQLRAAASTSAA